MNIKITIKNSKAKHLRVSEATIGFEPMIRVLQTRALPLGYDALQINILK